VKRSIVGFHQDGESHWVAELDCGHNQHTRHDPPFFSRPWVVTEDSRSQHLGMHLECVRCDRQEIPEGFLSYRCTKTFTTDSIPVGLQNKHSTKTGVWGIIHVLAGSLRYCIYEPYHLVVLLDAGSTAIVIPQVEHDVHPLGDVEFFIEFRGRTTSLLK
jgi:tellurite methyltransferase